MYLRTSCLWVQACVYGSWAGPLCAGGLSSSEAHLGQLSLEEPCTCLVPQVGSGRWGSCSGSARVSVRPEVMLKVSGAGDCGFPYILIVSMAKFSRTCWSSQPRNFGSTSRWGTM